jgi:hypothetical protein
MKFFTDFNVPKDSKIGITNLLSNITTKPGSHKGGWARLLKCQLLNAGYKDVKILDNKDSISEYGIIIFDLGAEFSGALNLFGGLDLKIYKRLWDLLKFEGSFYSWKNDLPDVNVLDSRRKNESTCEEFKNLREDFVTDIAIKLDHCKKFDHVYRTDKLLIGDSHTPSVWDPSYMIERRDGRTLKGMLERDTIQKYLFQDLKTLHVHCSSIDIRHHICREVNPSFEAVSLASKLIERVLKIPDIEIILNHTMGIEDESRELPKTGYFKGTPYYGSWDQRNHVRNLFNSVLDEALMVCNFKVLKFPKYFFDDSGKLKFEVMEKPASVHLSPEHYRWDLDKNELRWV